MSSTRFIVMWKYRCPKDILRSRTAALRKAIFASKL